jgi:hypothetical protein
MKRWVAVFLVALVAAGPVWAMKVNTFFRQGVDFSKFSTYALTVPEPDPKKDPDGSSKKIWLKVREVARETLELQGLTEVDPDKADLHLTYAGSLYAGAYGARWQGTGHLYGWTFGSVESYAQGTVVLELLDPETKDVQWRGAADPGFRELQEPDQTMKKIEKTVKKILKSYPPKQ